MHSGKRIALNLLVVAAVILSVLGIAPAVGVNRAGGDDAAMVAQANVSGAGSRAVDGGGAKGGSTKPIDQPNIKDKQLMMARQRLLEAGQSAEAAALAQTGTDRVLVAR